MSRDNLKRNLDSSATKLQKLIHNACLMNYTKNRRWIAKLIDSGRVYSCSGDNIIGSRTTTFKRSLFIMMDILDRKRGDDWDLHIYVDSFNHIYFKFILKYDEVKITNANRQEHIIKGLLVVIPIKYRTGVGAYPGDLMGSRISASIDEISCNYQHSHLNTTISKSYGDVLKEKTFCMGSGDVGFLISDVSNGNTFNEGQFEAMLYALDGYVAWESIDGGPHIRIGSITGVKNKSLTNLNIGEFDWRLWEAIASEDTIPVDFYIHEGRHRIKDNKKWDEYLKQMSLQLFPQHYIKFFCKQHPATKQYYSIESANIVAPVYDMRHPVTKEQAYIIYNGQKVYFKVYGYSKDMSVNNNIDLNEFFIYPKLSQNVREQIEHQLYTAAVRNSAIKKYYSSRNVRSNSEQGQVPV